MPATQTIDHLLRELLDWVDAKQRSYEEVMDAWRTSCPQLPVWEEANDRGFLSKIAVDGRCSIAITPTGRAFLDKKGRATTNGKIEEDAR